MTITKQCSRCGEVKPLTHFHSKSGRCITCKKEIDSTRKDRLAYRPDSNWGESARARKRRWAAAHRNPIKDLARRAVRAAIERGDLIRPQHCSTCGNESTRIDGVSGIQAHHHLGYENQLDVKWLCAKCHRQEDYSAREQQP